MKEFINDLTAEEIEWIVKKLTPHFQNPLSPSAIAYARMPMRFSSREVKLRTKD